MTMQSVFYDVELGHVLEIKQQSERRFKAYFNGKLVLAHTEDACYDELYRLIEFAKPKKTVEEITLSYWEADSDWYNTGFVEDVKMCWGCGNDYRIVYPHNPELFLMEVTIEGHDDLICPDCYCEAVQEEILEGDVLDLGIAANTEH